MADTCMLLFYFTYLSVSLRNFIIQWGKTTPTYFITQKLIYLWKISGDKVNFPHNRSLYYKKHLNSKIRMV